MNQVKIALIGTGGMGRKYAVMLANENVNKATLSAVVCRKEEAQQWAQDTLPESVHRYSSTDELFAHPDEYDAVLIATPHKTHAELAIKAFSLGKHVLCDKPAGVTVGQAQQMLVAAESANKVYGLIFHQRMYKKNSRIKQILESGQLGNIERVMLINSRYYRTRYYHQSGNWRSSWTGEGGGALINQGQHILDLWQWFFGVPDQIYANIPFGKYNEFLVDDEATLTMQYNSGMSAVFMLTTGEALWEERMEIVGSKGTLLMEDDKITITQFSQDIREYGKCEMVNSREKLAFTTTIEEYPNKVEPYINMIENFAAAVQGEERIAVCGQAGINALQIANAAYLSAWKGVPVKLPIDAEEYEDMLQKQIHIEEKRGMPH